VDLDGTFADSHPVLRRTFDAFLGARGIEATQAAFDSFDGTRLTQIVASLRERHRLPEPVEQLQREYEAGLAGAYGAIPPAPGATELVAATAAAGTTLVLVTSAPAALAEAFLAGAGLRSAFAGIVSAESGLVKPDPAPYLAALEIAGEDADRALAVEDSPSGVTSARAAGVTVVGVTQSATRASLLRDAGAEHVVSDLGELARAFVEAAS
jgi:HAD superfamily hydrolase (TIGR01509 family)